MSLCLRVTGGNRYQKQLVFGTIRFGMYRLLPKIRKLDVNVHIRDFKNDTSIGYCTDDSAEPCDYVRVLIKRDEHRLVVDPALQAVLNSVLDRALGYIAEGGVNSPSYTILQSGRLILHSDTLQHAVLPLAEVRVRGVV